MVTRFLSFLTDLVFFAFVYCFTFVSVVILMFDRNVDYDRFITPFYSLMIFSSYLYFLVPMILKGKTLGKRLFKISLVNHSGMENIIKIHVKYLLLRLLPIVSILLFLNTDILIVKVLLGFLVMYPAFDLIFMSMFDITFTDKMLKFEMKVY